MRKSIILLTLLLAAGGAFGRMAAAEEVERPTLLEDFFITETVYPQGQGETQLTLTGKYAKAEEGKDFTLAAGLEFGLTDQLQIEAEWDAYAVVDPDVEKRESGSGDVAVGFKYTFAPCPRTGIQVAAGFDVTLPTGSDVVSENAYVYEPYLVLSRDLGADTNLHASFSYGIVDPKDDYADEEADNEFSASLGAVYRAAPDWRLTLEGSVESNEFDTGSETEVYLTPGFLWKGLEEVEAGLAVAGGLTGDSDDYRLLGMVSFEF